MFSNPVNPGDVKVKIFRGRSNSRKLENAINDFLQGLEITGLYSIKYKYSTSVAPNDAKIKSYSAAIYYNNS
ncbi:sporulation protein Cse60 [Chloroflexota bacterium]